MENYVFVCIGTNQLIEDSFGPRVGNILKQNFYKKENIQVLGTMKAPIHYKNAHIFLKYLDKQKKQVILIDSALGKEREIGNTYVNLGGIELGKAFGKSFYFPAHLNIKTVVGVKLNLKNNKINKTKQKEFINKLAEILASKIIYTFNEII